jgi:hypothetical protein
MFASHQFECETGRNHLLLKPASLVSHREHIKKKLPFELSEKDFHEECFIHHGPTSHHEATSGMLKNVTISVNKSFVESFR